ncbi:ABC transporter ATP-binding protein [Prolixibacteraceae bacterium JC049]|nr:ABC transporter ATP-binding protein [Prolixibacteraceae bacterium JC049]
MEHLIEINEVSFAYDQEVILDSVSLTINDKDFIGVIGPNGGGKTTLLRLILGTEIPQSGTITTLESTDKRPLIGYLPQYQKIDKSFPINVFDVVRQGFLSGAGALKRFSKEENEKTADILRKVGMYEYRKRPIGELSGGQMQRVFLGRALVNEPRLLILDEPNTYVDNQFENDLYNMLTALNERMAILLVSHDLGTITSKVKSIACVNRTLNHHMSNKITAEQLNDYNCPIQIISHGEIPHTVLPHHHHKH